jgi:hypothetical protein
MSLKSLDSYPSDLMKVHPYERDYGRLQALEKKGIDLKRNVLFIAESKKISQMRYISPGESADGNRLQRLTPATVFSRARSV